MGVHPLGTVNGSPDFGFLMKNSPIKPRSSSGGVPPAAPDELQRGASTRFPNDLLGTTLATIHPDGVEVIPLTAFGNRRPGDSTSAPKPEPPNLSAGNASQ
jgi:hypothetical protein